MTTQHFGDLPLERLGPVTAQHQLAARLVSARKQVGLDISDVTKFLNTSVVRMYRIESGHAGIAPSTLLRLLNLYGIDQENEIESAQKLLSATRKRRWWRKWASILPPDQIEAIGLEQEARRLDIHSTFVIPPLLRTEGYSRSLIKSMSSFFPNYEDPSQQAREPSYDSGATMPTETWSSFDGFMDPLAEREFNEMQIRLATLRRAKLLKQPEPPKVTALINQGVLLRRIGTPSQWREQLQLLLELGRQPSWKVLIVPLDSTESLVGEFTIFQDCCDRAVHITARRDRRMILGGETSRVHQDCFDRIMECAADQKRSTAYIEKLIAAF